LEDDAEKKKRKQQWKQRMLTEEGRQRRDKRYPRAALKFYNDSPFKYLYDSGNDQEALLLNACGVDGKDCTTTYNHQCSTIGMNQILNTFMSTFSRESRYFNYNITLEDSADATIADILQMQANT
jgi:hypothetical protein